MWLTIIFETYNIDYKLLNNKNVTTFFFKIYKLG